MVPQGIFSHGNAPTTSALIASSGVISLAALWTLLWSTGTATSWSAAKKQNKVSKWQLWLAAQMSRSSYLLSNVRIPVAVLGSNLQEAIATSRSDCCDDEGLVDCHVLIQSGTISEVILVSNSTKSRVNEQDAKKDIKHIASFAAWFNRIVCNRVECYQSILIPCFADAHTHMIKTQTVPRNRNHTGTMTEALEVVEVLDRPQWAALPDDIFRRMDFAAQCALHHGTRAVRTHLDGCAAPAGQEAVQRAVYAAFDRVQDKYKGRLILQGVANLFLPLWLIPEVAEAHIERALSHEHVVLGAYVMNTADIEPDEPLAAMNALFKYAQEHNNVDVDMHIDECNDERCCALLTLCESLSNARKAGYTGHVVLGHCCALSLQSQERQKYICAQLGALNTSVVSNPFTNMGLQDRKGSAKPLSKPIPIEEPRTPQWRGITTLQELRAAGVNVATASDNVRDHWYPYGDYDMLCVWAQGQAMAHLDTAPSEGAWADVCTVGPSKAMGVPHAIGKGQIADLILFPSARRASELFSRPQTDRIVIRCGKPQTTSLPEFAEIDDLVAVKTRH